MTQPGSQRGEIQYDRRESDATLAVIQTEVNHMQGDLDKMREDLEKHIERTSQALQRLEDKLESGLERFDQKFLWIASGIFTLLITLLSDKFF